MKKTIALSVIIALSTTAVAEAKGVRMSRSVSGKPIAAKPKNQSANNNAQANTQKDATFSNTPNIAGQNSQAVQATGGNRLASFATGAAAGYMLSGMLTPAQAQANQSTAELGLQAVENASNFANTTVAVFKSIGGQIDPYLVEKTDGYRRYCIAGVQYLAPAQGGQTTPIVMVNPNGLPLQCNLVE